MELNSIAFIPDGNRRYAKANSLSYLQAYTLGTQKAWQVLDWISKYPAIKTGTFYTLSTENLTRSNTELQVLFKVFEHELDKILKSGYCEAKELRLKFIGRLNLFPKRMHQKMEKAEKLTENFSARTINLAIGYNGRSEIVDAAKKIAEQAKDNQLDLNSLSEDTFKNYLYSNFPDPDVIVRTSGTKRLSGFLTYQNVYSELCFVDKYWPEITEQDVDQVVLDFNERQRRFGK